MLKCLQIFESLWFGAILTSRKKMSQNVDFVLNYYYAKAVYSWVEKTFRNVHNIIFQKEHDNEPPKIIEFNQI